MGRTAARLSPRRTAALAGVWAALVLTASLHGVALDPRHALSIFGTGGLEIPVAGGLAALGGHLERLAALAVVALAAWSLGRPAARLIGDREAGWLGAIPFGLIGLGTLGLGLGLTGLVRPAVLTGVLCLAAVRVLPALPRHVVRRLPTFTGVFILLLALLTLPLALAPEVTYDALAYHLGAPHEYLKAGRIVRLEHMMYSDLPLLLQMTYLFAEQAGGEGAGKLVHWLVGLAGILTAGRLAGRRSAALLAGTPFIACLMMRANVDLGVLLFVTAAAVRFMRGTADRQALSAGVLLGAAAATKLSGSYGLMAGAAVILISRHPRAWKPLAAGALLVLLPWGLRAALTTGNPVYPFLNAFFGGIGWTPENDAVYAKDLLGANYGNVEYPGIWGRLAGPWLIVMKDKASEAALGPAVLVLLPLLALFPAVRKSASTKRLAVFAAVYAGGWFGSSRDPRFLLPVWPILAALASLAWVGLSGPAAKAVGGAVVLTLALALPYDAERAWFNFNPGPVLRGAISRERYATKIIAPDEKYVPMAQAATQLTPQGRKVLLVGDVKAAWIGPRALYPSMLDTPHLVDWLRESPSPSRLAVRFRQAGIGALLYDAGGVTYFRKQFGTWTLTPRERLLVENFWKARLQPIRWFSTPPPLILYAVRSTDLRPGTPPLPGWPTD